MDTKTSTQEIRDRIDSFLAEMTELVRMAALGSVHAALGGGIAPRRGPGSPRGAGRPPKSAVRVRRAAVRTGKRIRRSAEDLEKIGASVLAYVKSNAGQRLEQIGKALQVDTSILKRPVANLLAEKKLSTKGQKRGTMYFAGGRRSGTRKSKAGTKRKPAGGAGPRAKRTRRTSKKRAMRKSTKVKDTPLSTSAAA